MKNGICIDCINVEKEEDRLQNDPTVRKVWIAEDTYGNHVKVFNYEQDANKYAEQAEDEYYVRMYEVF